MKTVIDLLEHAKQEAWKLSKYKVHSELTEAIDILKNHESMKNSIELNQKIYNDTVDMTPRERQKYFDSWNGYGS